MRILFGALALVLCVTASASTKTPAAAPAGSGLKPGEASAVETLKSLTGDKLSIEQFFDGPGGLIGMVLVDAQNQRSVAWATPDGQRIILGAVLDKNGQNDTGVFARRVGAPVGPQPRMPSGDGGYSMSKDDVALLKTLPTFDEGDGKIELWIIGDPLCSFCKKAHEAAGLPQNLRAFKIHWILAPVVHGDQSAKIILDMYNHHIDLEQAMSVEFDPSFNPGKLDLTDEQRKYMVEPAKLLEDSIPNPPGPKVPAVITANNGHYSIRIGFDADALAGRPKAAAQAAAGSP